jgi:hypothetical protein
MKITIERYNTNITIDIEKYKTIGDLKTKIWLQTDIPFTYQELWYNEIQLDNQNTLEDYHILTDSKITMIVKIKKH